MAKELNIKRCWFHGGDKPHYDIPKRRIAEITNQCKLVSPKEVVKIIQMAKRKKKIIKEIVTLPVDKIYPYPKNAKIHTKDNMALIRQSIEEVGYINMIIVDEKDIILAGHGRYFVMVEDGAKEIEVQRTKGLTEEQKEKYRLYDNQAARTGKYDNELLVESVTQIMKFDEDFNVGILGIEGLAASFSKEVFNFDLGSKFSKKVKKKMEVVIITTDDLGSLLQKLESNNIEYILGNESTKFD